MCTRLLHIFACIILCYKNPQNESILSVVISLRAASRDPNPANLSPMVDDAIIQGSILVHAVHKIKVHQSYYVSKTISNVRGYKFSSTALMTTILLSLETRINSVLAGLAWCVFTDFLRYTCIAFLYCMFLKLHRKFCNLGYILQFDTR